MKISELLRKDHFQNFKLLTNDNTLDRNISMCNILDYEYAELSKDVTVVFDEDSLVLTTLLFAKDNENLIFTAIKDLEKFNISCFAFKTVIYEQLPAKVIEYCNNHRICVLSFSDEYFEKVIYRVMMEIQNRKKYDILDYYLNQVIAENMETDVIYTQIKRDYLAVNIYVVASKTKVNNADIIGTYQGIKFYLCKEIMFRQKAGLSNYQSSKQINQLIKQAYAAYIYSMIYQKDNVLYDNIGIYQTLVFDCLNHKQLTYLNPIRQQEDLLTTAIEFALTFNNVNQCANNLYVHKNTVRFRIMKIKQLLQPNGSEAEFYFNLNYAVHYYLIQQEVGKKSHEE